MDDPTTLDCVVRILKALTPLLAALVVGSTAVFVGLYTASKTQERQREQLDHDRATHREQLEHDRAVRADDSTRAILDDVAKRTVITFSALVWLRLD
ncbi:hypothetical protein HJD18_15570 [Thermoleophilia bacterium SCSIO 60948]|nr:hypothetical protein HJD18_15570 [Thermoleophilia bacterium SCSIO 60948]